MINRSLFFYGAAVNKTHYRARGACACGLCAFELTAMPKVRLICHCTVCQAFTGKAVSDVMIVFARDVKLSGERQAEYRNYRKYRFPPPNLKRGRCTNCLKPYLEIAAIWPLKIYFIPVANFQNPEILPAAAGHIFYEHRLEDIDDGTPKHEGYIDSQGALLKMIIHAV
jgi:hypothetical protein